MEHLIYSIRKISLEYLLIKIVEALESNRMTDREQEICMYIVFSVHEYKAITPTHQKGTSEGT